VSQLVDVASGDDIGYATQVLGYLEAAAPRDWLLLDLGVRATAKYHERIAWKESGQILSIGLSSMSNDGYRREAAVKKLAGRTEPIVGPFLALRLVDWVPQVAAAAAEGLVRIGARDPAAYALAAPIVLEMSKRVRGTIPSGSFISIARDNPAWIRALFSSPDARTRRWGFDLGDRKSVV
jgi:hypothetical protein